ncbi:peptidase [Crepidotus variabilis]|uniref:Peptidase n=1 Tax=Crepidotus variabilis TaxID=179855 RepID=A0A9P6ED16_9AGAR|nr:peptidase [Crepidotus variabilis]
MRAMISTALIWWLNLTLHFSFTLAGKFPLSNVKAQSRLPGNIVPNEFIIEVDLLSRIPTTRSYSRSLDAVFDHLQRRDIVFDVKKEFNSAGIFVGAAVSIQTSQGAAALANTPGVIDVRPIFRYPSPKPLIAHPINGLDDPTIPPDGQSTHVMTGVDKVHKEGTSGKGIKIGIIDTGVDYTHPVLGAGFGPGHKIAGGYDFVGNAFNGKDSAPMPDDDPLDQCNGHGTHVAGIIGAIPGNQFNISGVAYDAELYAYRVFGCNGDTPDDILIEALLRANDDGNDILSLSLGGADGWTEGKTSTVASRIADSGKVVVIASGNDGASGMFYTSGPGNAINAISVGSVDNVALALQSVLVSGIEHDPIMYWATYELPKEGTLPIYTISNDTSIADDGCNPLSDKTPDLSQYVTIVRRGTCTFVQKFTNLAAKGAKNVLVYDNGNGFVAVDKGNFYNAALIQAADGEFLVKQHAAGKNIKLTFPKNGRPVEHPDPNGGLTSRFSTYGPSNDFYFKPALVAPGGNILSTVPTNMGVYAVFSGTSMATPFIAGSAALLLEAKGKSKDVTSNARTLFETTAKYVPSDKTEGSLLQTVAQQGAGLINVYDAIHTSTKVTPGELILNDTANFKFGQQFNVKNEGTQSKAYKITHVPAGTALTMHEGTIVPQLGPVPLSNVFAQVIISPDSIQLGPGESQTVHLMFKYPTSISNSIFPLYSGFIQITGESVSDTYHVSYIGLGGSLKDINVLDDTDYFFEGTKLPVLLNGTQDVQIKPTNYTFTKDNFPAFLFRLVFGSALVTLDLVDPATELVPTIPANQPSRRNNPDNSTIILSFPSPHDDGGSYASVKVIGPLEEFKYVTRNDEAGGNGFNLYNLTEPTFANGSTIKDGQYRALLRALRVTGDPTTEEDYDSWLSPIFGIQKSQTT